MHQSSYALMQQFALTIRERFAGKPIRILDVGSNSVNGSYKDLFVFSGAEYIGLDIQAGPNVDVVPEDPYEWKVLPDDSFDVIISGQALEHIEFPWLIFEQIGRKLKPHGTACLIAPSRGPEHRYPVDCYRYYPDGLRALAKWSGLRVLECGYILGQSGFGQESDAWGDCRCVLTKDVSSATSSAYRIHTSKGTPERTSGRHRNNPLSLSDSHYFAYERPEVIQFILQQGIRPKRILELGCAAGAIARQLTDALAPDHYVGIEIEPAAAEQARKHMTELHVVDISATAPEALGLEMGSFDLLLALDVLEHLYNPWDVLAAYSELLVPGGHAVLSIPNSANIALIRQIIQGHWQYESAGLLDATHIRFFTRESIGQLIAGAGLGLVNVTSVLNPRTDLTQARDVGNNINLENVQISNLSKQDVINLFTFQFLVLAQKPVTST